MFAYWFEIVGNKPCDDGTKMPFLFDRLLIWWWNIVQPMPCNTDQIKKKNCILFLQVWIQDTRYSLSDERRNWKYIMVYFFKYVLLFLITIFDMNCATSDIWHLSFNSSHCLMKTYEVLQKLLEWTALLQSVPKTF